MAVIHNLGDLNFSKNEFYFTPDSVQRKLCVLSLNTGIKNTDVLMVTSASEVRHDSSKHQKCTLEKSEI